MKLTLQIIEVTTICAILSGSGNRGSKKMKKGLYWLLKVIIAACIATLVLSVFSLLYYNNGIRKTSTTGATDYVWENRFYSLGYEGYAWGYYDESGYNNVFGISGAEPDILLMGSSQMNAYNVSAKYSTAFLLNEALHDSELGYSVYNIGMEGHDFYTCSDNLEDAIATYSPKKYVIIETMTVALSIDKMEEVLNKTRVKSPAYDKGVIYYLQKIPYLRLLHKKIRDIQAVNISKENDDIEEVKGCDDSDMDVQALLYNKELDQYMKKLGKLADESGIVLILFYLPSVMINEDGSIGIGVDLEEISKISSVCQNYGIRFVDMSEAFSNNYQKNYELPYGFSNTEIGHGHLNRIGHNLVANELYKTILCLEDK